MLGTLKFLNIAAKSNTKSLYHDMFPHKVTDFIEFQINLLK